jgi:two-component system cell cycle sensor histidine kinase/response regulator CckA
MRESQDRTENPRTVLVVDDEPLVLSVAARMLTVAGYKALTASSGSDALALCLEEAEPIDVLLTDVNMPNMNGFELARRIVSHKANVPIMFMTGQASESAYRVLIQSQPGMDGHEVIFKPFTSSELTRRIDSLLEKSQRLNIDRQN